MHRAGGVSGRASISCEFTQSVFKNRFQATQTHPETSPGLLLAHAELANSNHKAHIKMGVGSICLSLQTVAAARDSVLSAGYGEGASLSPVPF